MNVLCFKLLNKFVLIGTVSSENNQVCDSKMTYTENENRNKKCDTKQFHFFLNKLKR